MAFDFVTRFAINPADSRLRRVLASMRCETLPRCLSPRPTHLNSINYGHKRYYSDAFRSRHCRRRAGAAESRSSQGLLCDSHTVDR
jgi:hypothetical protein